MNSEHGKIEDLYLQKDDGTKFSLIKCDLKYALDNIPTCDAVLTIGFRAGEKTQNTFKIEKESYRSTWKIILKQSINGGIQETITLFTGFISSVVIDKKSSPMGSVSVVRVLLTSSAGLLAMVNPVSYRYLDKRDIYYYDKFKFQSLNNIFNTFSEIFSFDVFKKYPPKEKLDKYIIYFYDFLIKEIKENKGGIGVGVGSKDFKASNYFSTDSGDVSFVKELQGNEGTTDVTLAQHINEFTIQRLSSSNLWTALRVLADDMYLSIIPKRDGKVDIKSTFPWKTWEKDKDIDLALNHIYNVRYAEGTSNTLRNISSVGVTLPGNISAYDTNSLTSGGDPQVVLYPPRDSVMDSGEVELVQIPEWLAYMVKIQYYGQNQTDKTKKEKIVDQAKIGEKEKEDRVKQARTVGEAVAKSFFANKRNNTTNVIIQTRWNSHTLLIDNIGTLVRFTNIPQASVSSSQDQGYFYGMVNEVILTFNIGTTGANSSATLVLSHVRDQSSQDVLSLDNHPIYENKGTK